MGHVNATAEHILVADDSLAIRRLVASRLRHAGFRVTEAVDGSEALERFRAEPASVVVTDVAMPRMGGLDLLSRLRGEQRAPAVILLTGSSGEDSAIAHDAARLGAHSCISKDARALDVLVLLVAEALDELRRRGDGARLRAGAAAA